MAWVERHVVRTVQPQDSVGIDWSNPITRGLVVATDSTGSLLTPLPVLASSEALRAPTPRGRLAKNSSASSNYTFRLSPTADDGLTFFAVIERNLKGYSDPNGGRIIQVSSVQFGGGYLSGLGLGSYANGLSLLFSIRRANYGGDASVSASVVESNGTEFQVVIGTYDIVNGARLFINGALVGTAPSYGQPIDRGFYDRLDTTGQALPGNLGGTYTSGILERALSISEVTEFSANPWQIFEPETHSIWYAELTLPRIVFPTSDVATGAWTSSTGGDLYSTLDEAVPDDGDYISVNSISSCTMRLEAPAYPGTANQALSYRASSTQGSFLTVTLKQGNTVIMTRTHQLSGLNTLYTQSLTPEEIALIGDGAIDVTLSTS